MVDLLIESTWVHIYVNYTVMSHQEAKLWIHQEGNTSQYSFSIKLDQNNWIETQGPTVGTFDMSNFESTHRSQETNQTLFFPNYLSVNSTTKIFYETPKPSHKWHRIMVFFKTKIARLGDVGKWTLETKPHYIPVWPPTTAIVDTETVRAGAGGVAGAGGAGAGGLRETAGAGGAGGVAGAGGAGAGAAGAGGAETAIEKAKDFMDHIGTTEIQPPDPTGKFTSTLLPFASPSPSTRTTPSLIAPDPYLIFVSDEAMNTKTHMEQYQMYTPVISYQTSTNTIRRFSPDSCVGDQYSKLWNTDFNILICKHVFFLDHHLVKQFGSGVGAAEEKVEGSTAQNIISRMLANTSLYAQLAGFKQL
jgi:hypothetical protein